MPVAQVNIGQMLHPLDDPRMAGFTDNLDRVNAIADRSPGFVWRWQGEMADLAAEGISLFDGDPCALATLSVWQDAAALKQFVRNTLHGRFVDRRASWFRPQTDPIYAIWPVAEGHVPGFPEALARLDELRANGPSERVFDFAWIAG